jgi:hypothetical protein
MPRVLAIVPARMGSARVPNKNARELEPGLSLAQQAVDCARLSGAVSRTVVSTDRPDLLPIYGAEVSARPADLSGPTADIAATVRWELDRLERRGDRFDYVVTLQPAVVARSPGIVADLIDAVADADARGGITMARAHPWTWRGDGHVARAHWVPGPYPRSQDAGPHWSEINACQVACASAVRDGLRWAPPLIIAELPPWCTALDIDTADDLAMAIDLWPWARPRLQQWRPPLHLFDRVGPWADNPPPALKACPASSTMAASP